MHDWLHYAERVDPNGPAGGIARITHLEIPCSFEGKSDWRDGLIPFGEEVLHDFPSSRWAPFVDYILGRAYAAKLLLAYPNGDPEGQTRPIKEEDAIEIREAGSAHLRAFLKERPDAPESHFAAQEAGRLLARLPPSPIGFGCSGN